MGEGDSGEGIAVGEDDSRRGTSSRIERSGSGASESLLNRCGDAGMPASQSFAFFCACHNKKRFIGHSASSRHFDSKPNGAIRLGLVNNEAQMEFACRRFRDPHTPTATSVWKSRHTLPLMTEISISHRVCFS